MALSCATATSSFRDNSGQREIMQVSEIPLKGAHNLENVLAAVCAGALMGCAPERFGRRCRDFKAVEHRLEFVATIRGVDYYNDSKATNVDATIKALESFPANIHLILGGKDKGSDYAVLNDLLRQRVKRVYTIGAAAAKIESQIKGRRNRACRNSGKCDSQSECRRPIRATWCLLAPACASFDQFKSYEHRGQVFKDMVRSLAADARRYDSRARTKSVNRRCRQSKISTIVSPCLRGEMKSHGKARQCRSLVVYRHHGAGICWPGHGVFGVGGDGQGALRLALCFPVEAVGLGRGRACRDGRHHARRLPPLQASGAGVFADGLHHAVIDFCFLPRPIAQHTSLDPFRRLLLPAVRVGQARAHPVSRLFSGKPLQDYR